MNYRLHSILLTTLLLGSCRFASAQKIYYAPGSGNQHPLQEDTTQLLYTIYLFGDIKNPQPNNENLKLLKNHISKQDTQSAVVVLGDILYPLGLRDSSDRHFVEDEVNLNISLIHSIVLKGKSFFCPVITTGRREGKEAGKMY
ncbi:MAG: hypothetical protein IPL46_02520 [Saprospiraceae bacterium]|nr:hypothetical protein [Saprospiraceae bacterium]